MFRHSMRLCALMVFGAMVGGGTLAQASVYSTAVLGDSPSHYWRLEETAGPIASDSGSPSPVNGTYGAGVSGFGAASLIPTDTASDKAMHFNQAANDFVNVGSLGSVTSAGTIEFWMTADTLSSYPNAFATGPTNDGFRFEERADGRFDAVVGNSTTNYEGFVYLTTAPGSKLATGTPYHVVLTWDAANNVAGYLNGVQSFSTSASYMPSTFSSTTIGMGFNTTRLWKGVLDEVAMYSQTLTPSQVSAHYTAATGSPPAFTTGNFANRALALSPIAYWRMEDGPAGPVTSGALTAKNSSGSGATYDGTYYDGMSLVPGVSPLPGVPGLAAHFTGTGTSPGIQAPNTGFPTGDSARTFTTWFRTTQPSNTYPALFDYGTTGTFNQAFLITLFGGTGNDFSGKIGLTQWGSGLWSTVGVNDGQWHHLAITVDPFAAGATPSFPLTSLYLDGQLDNSTTSLAINTALGTAAWIGQSGSTAATAKYIGDIDELALYGWAMTAYDIQMLYAGSAFVPEPATVMLLGLGGIGLLVLAGRRRRAGTVRA